MGGQFPDATLVFYVFLNAADFTAEQYLIYNKSISYVELLLSGKLEEYLRNSTDYTHRYLI